MANHNQQSFNREQVTALLKRAIELQQENESDRGAALSLDEVRQIAADAGIPSRYIDAAAAEGAQPTAGGG